MAKKLEVKKDYEKGVITFITPEGELQAKLEDFPQDILARLALYGLGVKISRAVAGKGESEVRGIVETNLETLKQGKWATAPQGFGKEALKQVILDTLKSLPPEQRQATIQALKSAGTWDKAGLKEEDLL